MDTSEIIIEILKTILIIGSMITISIVIPGSGVFILIALLVAGLLSLSRRNSN